MPAQTVIKLRRGTASQWTTANPTLAAGEMGVETDTNKFKFGNGSTAWSSLAYVSSSSGGGAVDWADVLNKPSTFTPSSHTHAISDITSLQTSLDGKAATGHTHGISDVTGLQTSLDGKQAVVAGVSSTEIGYLDGVTSAIQTQIDGKAATSHTHDISAVTGLQTALDGKVAAIQPIQELTGAYTLASGSNGKLFFSASASEIVVTVNFANIQVGERMDFLQTAGGKIRISPFMGFNTVSDGNKLSTNGAGTALSLTCYAYDGSYKKLAVVGNLS